VRSQLPLPRAEERHLQRRQFSENAGLARARLRLGACGGCRCSGQRG
jgi:hypothetical protein